MTANHSKSANTTTEEAETDKTTTIETTTKTEITTTTMAARRSTTQKLNKDNRTDRPEINLPLLSRKRSTQNPTMHTICLMWIVRTVRRNEGEEQRGF